MQSTAITPEEYIKLLPDNRKEPIIKLREEVVNNLPPGFEEIIGYGMLGYVIPLSVYPSGYHCNPKDPLPFINIASQKNYISVYHMALFAHEPLLTWFTNEFSKQLTAKPDMGKSCIRFKKPEHIPYKLIGELAGKITAREWIAMYETLKRK